MLALPTKETRQAAVAAVFMFLILFGLGTYLTAYLKGEISKSLFTVSQSLAFGNQPVVIIFLTMALLLVGFINQTRGPAKLLWLRQFMLLLVYGLVISLLWVTTYYSTTDHYILASIIFTTIVIYILMTSVLYYKNSKGLNKLSKAILIMLPVLSTLVFIGLIVANLGVVREKISQFFPSLENSMIFLFLVCIIIQGFMI